MAYMEWRSDEVGLVCTGDGYHAIYRRDAVLDYPPTKLGKKGWQSSV
jgi:hypothetical protein